MTRSAAAFKALAFLFATALAAGLGGCIVVPPEEPAKEERPGEPRP